MIVLPSLRLRLPAPRFPPRYIVALQGVTQGGFDLELFSGTITYGVVDLDICRVAGSWVDKSVVRDLL